MLGQVEVAEVCTLSEMHGNYIVKSVFLLCNLEKREDGQVLHTDPSIKLSQRGADGAPETYRRQELPFGSGVPPSCLGICSIFC